MTKKKEVYWVVSKQGTRCIHKTFEEALSDWKSHSGEIRWLYPILMSQKKWDAIKDFSGW